MKDNPSFEEEIVLTRKTSRPMDIVSGAARTREEWGEEKSRPLPSPSPEYLLDTSNK